MTLLASCKLTYCLCPVLCVPTALSYFWPYHLACQQQRWKKYFSDSCSASLEQKFDYISIYAYKAFLVAVIVCFINWMQTWCGYFMFSLYSNKPDVTGLIPPKAGTIWVSFVYLGQARALYYYWMFISARFVLIKTHKSRLSLDRFFLRRMRAGQAQTFRDRSSCNLTLFMNRRESKIERLIKNSCGRHTVKKGRIKRQLTADIYTFKLDKDSHKQAHKRFVVCGSLHWSDSKLAGKLDITRVLYCNMHCSRHSLFRSSPGTLKKCFRNF